MRNLPVVRGPMPVTVSHIPRGGVKSTTRVRPTILANDVHLPKCLVKSCNRKAHYSEGGSEVTVCATHRKAHHVRRYALLHSKHTCHCGTRATYKDGSQYPIYCYWHKKKNFGNGLLVSTVFHASPGTICRFLHCPEVARRWPEAA